ncbi:hypothetical protein [Alkalinema sp. FACHB-956]|uniref:hypothetical protein n=1 Tax=Alkalinema sp. FACHB-956 TaxID=2692768 RepID=UPI0016867180|nr:hypothetical protein [Alkalinema sp. FACHB-956]MBD2328840.1 hypothetical protein [Alkalinema sp. FACHB-956]
MKEDEPRLNVYLQEYNQLKQEQTQRIGWRDNLLYVTLSLYGVVLGLALGETLGDKAKNPYALLILPWVSLVLGWNYLVNDQKITAIGHYIRHTLVQKISHHLGSEHPSTDSILGWELAHRSDRHRQHRKFKQMIVDEITFVISGIAALVTFSGFVSPFKHWLIATLCVLELLLLLGLGIEIVRYADRSKGH